MLGFETMIFFVSKLCACMYFFFAPLTTGFTSFAECRLHSANASLHSANSLPSVTLGKRHSAKPPMAKGSLPSVEFWALGKDFAERLGTRQSSHVAPP